MENLIGKLGRMQILKRSFIFCGLLFLGSFCIAQSGLQATELEYLKSFYEDLHQNPELSFLEKRTAAKLAKEMETLGYKVTKNVGGNGVVAVLENGEGPTILIRADMDALPVLEETGLPYASTHTMEDITGDIVPVMHACGHDMHMTVWLGTARRLMQNKSEWSGKVIFIGQPAEERSGGAKAMLKDGLYERFGVPDYALALHVNAGMAAGTVGICPGYAMANVDMMKIEVRGQGGHGASPHLTKDPVAIAARLILDLQTIVSREISPFDPSVVTVGSIHGGNKGNVIPNEVVLELTMRSYTDEVRNHIIEAIERKCKSVAESAGLPEDLYPIVTLRDEYTPSLYNDPALSGKVWEVFSNLLGKSNVLEIPPSMVGEDFGLYSRTVEKVPSLLFWLGAVDPAKKALADEGKYILPSLHSSKFTPEPNLTINTGVDAMSAAVLKLLSEK